MDDLHGLTPGDRIIISPMRGGLYARTVANVHKKYLVDNRGGAWNLKDGRRRGERGWEINRAYVPTPDLVVQLRVDAAKRACRRMIKRLEDAAIEDPVRAKDALEEALNALDAKGGQG